MLFAIAVWLPPAIAHADEPFSAFTFLDSYYATSRNSLPGSERLYFTQASRNEQPRLNLAAAGLNYDDGTYRGRLTGQYGDSVDINYSSEPHKGFRYLMESYAGMALTEHTGIDIGTFSAHIGAEAWMSKDNPNYTRSLVAEFSPYYETGARLTHQFSSEWSGQVLVLNGWQNTTDKRHPALGTQLRRESGGFAVTSNTFAGSEERGNRLFHDLIVSQNFDSGAALTAALDTGYQSDSSSTHGWWWGYTVFGKLPLERRLTANARFESYQDPNNVIAVTPTDAPFRMHAISVGADVALVPGLMLRGEIKQLLAAQQILADADRYRNSDTLFIVSLNCQGDTVF